MFLKVDVSSLRRKGREYLLRTVRKSYLSCRVSQQLFRYPLLCQKASVLLQTDYMNQDQSVVI